MLRIKINTSKEIKSLSFEIEWEGKARELKFINKHSAAAWIHFNNSHCEKMLQFHEIYQVDFSKKNSLLAF